MDSAHESVEPSLSDSEYESLWRDLWAMEDEVVFSHCLSEEEDASWPDFAKVHDSSGGADSLGAHPSVVGSRPVHNPLLEGLVFLPPLVNGHAPAAVFHERLVIS
ncbi:unnamed protein product [Calypogeia fissa]